MTDQNQIRTPEEIEALKNNWLKDPCWDIEDSGGFEAHYEELKAYHDQVRTEWKEKRKQGEEKRIEKVMLATGIDKTERETLLSLRTWNELEDEARDAERYTEDPHVSINATLVRATLLQAAQLKRIADALEKLVDQDDNSFLSAYKIWGMK